MATINQVTVNGTTYDLAVNAANVSGAASQSAAGLMSAADKTKLDGITASADSIAFTQKLTSGTEVGTITINGAGTKLYAPTNTDTKNTAGSTNTSSKIFLVGATSQAANPQTYSHDTAYVGTDGHLYSDSKQVVNISGAQTLSAKTLASPTITGSINMGRNEAVGENSVALGYGVEASGAWSSAFGNGATASNTCSHAEGLDTTASGENSHAEGDSSIAEGESSHAEGCSTASGNYSHAEGCNTTASNNSSHAEGNNTTASGENTHAEGYNTKASGPFSHAEGFNTIASGSKSHAEGDKTIASGSTSHAEGYQTVAYGAYSHAEGGGSNYAPNVISDYENLTAQDLEQILENERPCTFAFGDYSHAEGFDSCATGNYSHAEGCTIVASGDYSHVEGNMNIAQAKFSHCEGSNNLVTGVNAHAEGSWGGASGNSSHSEGSSCSAGGASSHAEGMSTKASGNNSHAEGMTTTASNYASHASGKFNKAMTSGGAAGTQVGDVFVIGNGTSASKKSNAFRVTYTGAAYGLSAFNSSGADYAEFVYPWFDDNKDDEDRIGYFVTFKDGKLYKATSKDIILGVTSGNPSVVGNADEDYYWKYERDEFNRVIFEDVEEEVEQIDEEGNIVLDENGNPVMVKTGNIIKNGRMKLNPDYDPTLQNEYVERKDRKEWDYVGMVGMLPLRDDGTCISGQYCKCNDDGIATLATPEEAITNRFTYVVLERVSDNVVKIKM